MFRRWVLPILFLLAIGAAGAWLVLARGGGPRRVPPAPATAVDAPAVAEVPDPPFGIVFGGELGGRLLVPPCSVGRLGGAHRVVEVVDAMRGAVNVAMVLDTGDLAAAPGAAGALEVEAGLRFLEAMGPTFAAVGEKDLLAGLDRWRAVKALMGPKVTVLCANLRDAGDRELTAAWAPLKIGKRRAVVTAVLSPSFEKGLRDAGVEVKLLPPLPAIREALKAAGKADFVVVISHAPFAESKALLRDLPEADLVVTAHAGEHADFTSELVEGRHLVTSETGWQVAGGVTFVDDGPGRRFRYLDTVTRPVPVTDSPPHPIKFILDQITGKSRVEGVLEGSLREAADREPTARYVGARACATCHGAAHLELQKPGAPHSRSLDPVKQRGFLRVSQCLSCHVTAPGRKGGHVAPGDAQASVSCEACHGPGAEHVATGGKARLLDAKASCAACHVPEMGPEFRYEDAWPKVKHGK